MIALPSGTRIWLAAGVTDIQGLRRAGSAGAEHARAEPFLRTPLRLSGTARRHGQDALVRWRWTVLAGQAARARPLRVAAQASSGSVSLTSAQLSMLLEGIDWRRPQRTWQPELAA